MSTRDETLASLRDLAGVRCWLALGIVLAGCPSPEGADEATTEIGDDGTTPTADSAEEGTSPTSGPTESETTETDDTGGSGLDPEACEAPETLLQYDSTTPSGLVRCADGLVHREEALACLLPEPPTTTGTCRGGSLPPECSSDEDCTTRPGGECKEVTLEFPESVCTCHYPCQTDDECGSGVCECGPQEGDCTGGSCTERDDCPSGLCALTRENQPCSEKRFECTSDADACRVHADCAEGFACYWSKDEARRICAVPLKPCG